jgi:hypothetical protein
MPCTDSSGHPWWPIPAAVPCVVVTGPRAVPLLPVRYVLHIVIVIVVVLAVIGPPGQVEAALFALAAVLPLLGARKELA